MKLKTTTIVAAAAMLALGGAACADEPIVLTQAVLDDITAGECQCDSNTLSSGGDINGGGNANDYDSSTSDPNSANYGNPFGTPSGGVSDQTGHTAHMNDKSQP